MFVAIQQRLVIAFLFLSLSGLFGFKSFGEHVIDLVPLEGIGSGADLGFSRGGGGGFSKNFPKF